MDALSRIVGWLSDHEAAISAVAAILAIAAVLFTAIRFLLPPRSQPSEEPTAKPSPEEDPILALPTGPVVAVLPFENLSRDPEQEYFSDGLTDDIITALSRFKDLLVIARNSTFRYKGQPLDVRQLRKELGARYVLEGSVQRAASRIRITVQLLDANDGTHLWAETYDRELSASDVFDVQDDITRRVVATIGSLYGVISRSRLAEIKAKPTDSLEAYEAVLHLGAYYSDNYVAPEHEEVRDRLEQAVRSDPDYADAWAALSLIYLDEYRFGYNPRANPLDRSLEAARRAIALDPTSQLAHEALPQVYFFRHQLDAFLAETERALALNPNNAVCLSILGQMLHFVGDERGIALVHKAMALDPFHATWFYIPIADHYFEKGEHEEALAVARKIDIPGLYWPQILLAGVYAELGRQKEARLAVEELQRVYPGFSTKSLIDEWQKWNLPDDRIRLWVAALRKAGLPE